MMKFSELERRHDKAMEDMCDGCDNENCTIHGGDESVCDSLVSAEDVWNYIGDRECHERRDENV